MEPEIKSKPFTCCIRCNEPASRENINRKTNRYVCPKCGWSCDVVKTTLEYVPVTEPDHTVG